MPFFFSMGACDSGHGDRGHQLTNGGQARARSGDFAIEKRIYIDTRSLIIG